jgi:hypothetical protein
MRVQETSPALRCLLRRQSALSPGMQPGSRSSSSRPGCPIADPQEVGVLAVTASFAAPTFVPSPVLYTKPDGTAVTNFHDSLARWAGVSDSARHTAQWQSAVTAAILEQRQRMERKWGGCLASAPPVPVLGVDQHTARVGLVIAADDHTPSACET